MTYLKSTSIALALSAVLGASAAYAGGDKPSFIELDANADGQVSMTRVYRSSWHGRSHNIRNHV